MRVIVLFILLISTAFGAACTENLLTLMNADVGISVGAVFTFTIVIICLAFAAAKITNNAACTIFYKDELFHLFFSAVLLASIGGILFMSCSITSAFLDFALKSTGSMSCYTGQESPQAVALCGIEKLESDGNKAIKEGIQQSINYEMSSTVLVTLYNPMTGAVSVPWYGYRKTYASQLDMVVFSYIMPAMVSLSLQKLLIAFSVDLVTYLLPIAFLFRIFPPTRHMGNVFIAAAIALYTIVPTMYALNASMDDMMFSAAPCSDDEVDLGSGLSLSVEDAVMGGCDKAYSFWRIARIIPHAFFFPNLTLALVITCLSGINKALRVLG